ncbi:MAG: DUF4339 domain-containing protein [Xanthomonadales bacterium]|nr:DUF4339 domain-containing protein [Xanthomonadales bacterium]
MAHSKDEWHFVGTNGSRLGPHKKNTLLAMFRSGQIKAHTLVWSPGMNGWRPFSEAFRSVLTSKDKSSTSTTLPPPPSPASKQRTRTLKDTDYLNNPKTEEAHRRAVNAVKNDKGPMRHAGSIGLYFLAWIVGSVLAYMISRGMGILYAQGTFPLVLGFWLGKRVLKNRRREWGGIIAFPIIGLLSSFLGFVMGQAIASLNSGDANVFAAFSTIGISFAFSCALFGLLNLRTSS